MCYNINNPILTMDQMHPITDIFHEGKTVLMMDIISKYTAACLLQ